MILKCDICGLESEFDEAFKKVRKLFHSKTTTYCPICWSKREIVFFKIYPLLWGLITIVGAILVFINSSSWFGWFLLNLSLFGIFKVLMILPHELGHAVVGLFLGMRISRIIVGCGRTFLIRRFWGFQWEIKLIPLGGCTWVTDKSLHFYRLRHFLMTLSGPLADFLILILLLSFAPQEPNWDMVKLYPFTCLYLVTMLDLFISLMPINTSSEYGSIPNDGLALLTIPFLSQTKIQKALSLYYILAGSEYFRKQQYESAKECYEEGLAKYPNNTMNLLGLGAVLIEMEEFEEAREIHNKLLQTENLNSYIRFVVLNNIAINDIRAGWKESFAEADSYSAQAYKAMPWFPNYKGTRGAVLVELGKVDEGLPLLKEAMEAHEESTAKALCACYITLGEKRRNNIEEARRYFEIAHNLDPKCQLLNRVANELEEK